MAYTLSTNRLAKDFNRALHLHFQRTVANYNATQWDGALSGNDVDDTNGGVKDSQCTAFKADWENNSAWVWSFTKHASNYLIGQLYNVSFYEFYPPCIIQESATDYKIIGKVNGEGYGYSGTDGVAFSSDGLFLAKGTAGQWDDIQSSPNVMRKIGSTYECLYSGYGDSPAYNHKIGHASKASWGTSWTKSGGNPVATVAAYNSANGTNYDGISVTDAVLVGNQWYYFGNIYDNAFSTCDLCYGIGAANDPFSNVVLNIKIVSISDLSPSWAWCQSPSVFKHPVTGKWMMTFTMGNITQTGTDNQAIYCFASDRSDTPIFTIDDFFCKPILYVDTSKAHEDNYNYAANWLKDNNGNLIAVSGNYRMYYAGHSTGASPTYTGVTCLASITTIPQL